jgi:hypothetical protein
MKVYVVMSGSGQDGDEYDWHSLHATRELALARCRRMHDRIYSLWSYTDSKYTDYSKLSVYSVVEMEVES